MWMVDPALMCRKHLLGEHVELHMLVGSIKRGKSLEGFVRNRLIQPKDILARHDILAEEMARRGYKHKSPLEQPELTEDIAVATVSVTDNEVELFNRCPDCRARILEANC